MIKRKVEETDPYEFKYCAPPRKELDTTHIADMMYRKRVMGVVGCRTFTDEATGFEILDAFQAHLMRQKDFVSEVVSGEARGADAIAKRWARAKKILYTGYPPLGPLSDPASYHKRNQQIVDRSHIVFAFWDMKSPGTRSTIEKARTRGCWVEIVDITQLKPRKK